MTLARRLENAALAKFNKNKLQALDYLDKQAQFYARKADRMFGTPYHKYWRDVYKAYSSARFSLAYWLELDNQPLDNW